MFNSYVTKVMPNYPQVIHEHRATTDHSLQILSEMENRIKERLINTVHVDTNYFKCAWTVFKNPMDDCFNIIASIDLNGERSNLPIRVPLLIHNPKEFAQIVREKLILHISNILVGQLFSQHGTELSEQLSTRNARGSPN